MPEPGAFTTTRDFEQLQAGGERDGSGGGLELISGG
jgi:hypothetical protein